MKNYTISVNLPEAPKSSPIIQSIMERVDAHRLWADTIIAKNRAMSQLKHEVLADLVEQVNTIIAPLGIGNFSIISKAHEDRQSASAQLSYKDGHFNFTIDFRLTSESIEQKWEEPGLKAYRSLYNEPSFFINTDKYKNVEVSAEAVVSAIESQLAEAYRRKLNNKS